MPGTPHFVDWDDFRSRFRTEFFPLHLDAVATNKLEGTSYFQNRRAVDDYLDEFRDLISNSGYSDPKTIVVKFRRGLNPSIADAVATMASGRPDYLDQKPGTKLPSASTKTKQPMLPSDLRILCFRNKGLRLPSCPYPPEFPTR